MPGASHCRPGCTSRSASGARLREGPIRAMGDLGMSSPVVQSGGKLHPRTPSAGQGGNRLLMGRRVLLALLSAAVLVGLMAQPGAAVNVPQPAVVSSNPADWTPHVLDGKVAAIVQVGNKIVAGGSFTRINGVAQKSLVTLRLSDGARITAFKGKTNARVKDMAVSGGRLYIGGTFKTANGVARSALAAVDPVTRGALGRCQPGLHRPPQRHRQHRQARHQPRRQPDGRHRQLDLRGRPAARPDRHAQPGHQPISVTDWATTRYQQQCAKVFDTYMRDVDISPDGSYFVVGTTGAFRAGSLCDAAARWERGASGSGQQPTWVDYTGGDTLYSIAITGTAVYVGGHQRRMNNSFAADKAGPGAVAREGIAALDPVNGLPLSWNPGRDRGVGAFALVATAQGLWVGSDTDRIGRYEYHAKIAFMPLAGGTPVPESRVGTLPGDLFRIGTDNTMTRRSFTGTTLGAPSTV